MQNAPREHSAILLTSTKLPPVFKTFVLSTFEWPLKTGLIVRRMLKFCVKQDIITLHGANNNGADQTAHMHRLVCAFIVGIKQSQVLSHCFLSVLLLYVPINSYGHG